MTARQKVIALIGLVLALLVPSLGPTRYLPNIPGIDPMYTREVFWWALFAIVLLYIRVVERRPLSSVGLHRATWKTAVFGIVFGIVAVLGITAIYLVVFPKLGLHMNRSVMESLLRAPFAFRFLVVTRAALMEETLFRGYGIERLTEWTGNRWIAGAITCGLFTVAHLSSWGWAQLIVAGWGGVVLTALYLWRRDLACNMLAHWVTDGIGFLLPH